MNILQNLFAAKNVWKIFNRFYVLDLICHFLVMFISNILILMFAAKYSYLSVFLQIIFEQWKHRNWWKICCLHIFSKSFNYNIKIHKGNKIIASYLFICCCCCCYILLFLSHFVLYYIYHTHNIPYIVKHMQFFFVETSGKILCECECDKI